jgi:hypothetical protein
MLMVRPLVRTVLMASLKLFCLPFLVLPVTDVFAAHGVHAPAWASLFLAAGHRSLECKPSGKPLGRGSGLGPREKSSSLKVAWSGSKSGKGTLVGEGERRCSKPAVVACGTISVFGVGGDARFGIHGAIVVLVLVLLDTGAKVESMRCDAMGARCLFLWRGEMRDDEGDDICEELVYSR